MRPLTLTMPLVLTECYKLWAAASRVTSNNRPFGCHLSRIWSCSCASSCWVLFCALKVPPPRRFCPVRGRCAVKRFKRPRRTLAQVTPSARGAARLCAPRCGRKETRYQPQSPPGNSARRSGRNCGSFYAARPPHQAVLGLNWGACRSSLLSFSGAAF